jgi:hypothetical protein
MKMTSLLHRHNLKNCSKPVVESILQKIRYVNISRWFFAELYTFLDLTRGMCEKCNYPQAGIEPAVYIYHL